MTVIRRTTIDGLKMGASILALVLAVGYGASGQQQPPPGREAFAFEPALSSST